MKLGEQLHELRFNVLRDTSDLIQGETDSLWTDDTLLLYIKDAERRFARRTFVLRDGTTAAICQVRLKAGHQTYPLHESILGVVSARYELANNDLQRTGHAVLSMSTPPESLSFDPSDIAVLPPGAPIAFFTDETLVYASQQRVTLSVYPVPDAVADGKLINIRVVRLPLCGYTKGELNRESELPEDNHLDVLEWAAYRAQRTWDGDAGSPVTADKHKQAFDEAVTLTLRDVKRKLFSNIAIGYGSNGFSWTR